MRSFRRRRYRGHRCTIVKSQSRSFSFPQRGSASCVERNDANAGLYWGFGCIEVGGEMRFDNADMVEGNDVTNGLYSERYGK